MVYPTPELINNYICGMGLKGLSQTLPCCIIGMLVCAVKAHTRPEKMEVQR